MIENYFLVCGITIHNPKKVRNDEFLKKIMNNVNETIAVKRKSGKDPFSYILADL